MSVPASYGRRNGVETVHKHTIYGLPLNPAHLLEELDGASFCVSYGTRDRLGKQLDEAIMRVGHHGVLLVDNGAFSMHKKGVSARDEAYLADYEAWAQDILDRCPQAIAVIPDVIGGTVEENAELVNTTMLPFERSMPIWHMHEPLHYLLHLCDAGFDYVGIGSSGDFWQVGTPAWTARINEALAAIDAWEAQGNGGNLRPRLHMMRAQSQAHLFVFDSSDSCNVAMNHGRYKSEGPGYVSRFAGRVSSKIRASATADEAEHQAKRPLLGHIEWNAWREAFWAELASERAAMAQEEPMQLMQEAA